MITCVGFKELKKGCLLGFADLFIDEWGIEIKGCGLFQKNSSRWVGMPSKELKKNGETIYSPVVRFPEKAQAQKFSEDAKKAIEDYMSTIPEKDHEDPQMGFPF